MGAGLVAAQFSIYVSITNREFLFYGWNNRELKEKVMKLEIDANKILTAIILALVMYIGKTVYMLDKDMALVQYKLIEQNRVLQDIYDNKRDK